MASNPKIIKVASPGRINLIGEHIDYNDGLVLPAAIDKCIHLTLSPSKDPGLFSVTSEDFDDTLRGDLSQLPAESEGWHKYIIGVISEIQKRTDNLSGFTCTLRSEIPVGSGVSSSAALECGLAFGLNELFDLGLSQWDLIHIGQDSEQNYVGTQCGIMDQFASVMGKEDHCMLLDCKTLEFEYVSCDFEPYKLLLLNTNVSHNLAASGYNQRREESASALSILAKFHNTNPSYSAIDTQQIEAAKAHLSPIQYKRARFVVEEIDRVRKAVKALKKNNLAEFGALLYQSHDGLSQGYEVSCPELDFLVEQSRGRDGVAGARMMGGGFGGCTLNLIHQAAIPSFVEMMQRTYNEQFDIALSWFEANPGPGTLKL